MNARYKIVRISGKNYYLHRLVWEAEHGSIPIGHHVHHKDGNPRNNDLGNLELLSKAEHHREHAAEAKLQPGYLAQMARAGGARPITPFKCAHCGIDAVGKGNGKARRYCSRACNSNATYARRKAA